MQIVESLEASQISALRHMRVVKFEVNGRCYPLVIARGVYAPDTWTRMLLRGLLAHLPERPPGPLIVEVGVGSGVVPVILSGCGLLDRSFRYIGLDVNEVACEAARLNIQINCSDLRATLIPGGNLLERLPSKAYGHVDVISANLPQVPDAELAETNPNDYYRPPSRSSAQELGFDQRGLGLLFDLLMVSRSALSSTGAIVLTVAGRCGIAEISRLFTACGMTFHVLDRAFVKQDRNTSIEHFRNAESATGKKFEFYADARGRCPISAVDAMHTLGEDSPVYHDLYAVVARPTDVSPT